MPDARAIVDQLLETYDGFDAVATVKKAHPDVKLLPSHRFPGGMDVILLGEKKPFYVGTVGPRGNGWRVVAQGKNLGRRVSGRLAFLAPTVEDAAQRLLDVLKPWWRGKLRWERAFQEVEESQEDELKDMALSVPHSVYKLGYHGEGMRYQEVNEYASLADAYAGALRYRFHDDYHTTIELHADGQYVKKYVVTSGGGLLDLTTRRMVDLKESALEIPRAEVDKLLQTLAGVAKASRTVPEFTQEAERRLSQYGLTFTLPKGYPPGVPGSANEDGIYLQPPYSLRDFSSYLARVSRVLYHELIHHEQLKRSPNPAEMSRSAERLSMTKGGGMNMQGYRQQKQEIMAFAGTLIDDWRAQGLTPADMKKRLKAGRWSTPAGHEVLRHENRRLYNLFLKYAYAYVDSAGQVAESFCDEIDAAAREAEKPNSEEQAEAGNYKKGHCSIQGLPIAIENAKGSTRSGTDKNGKAWSCVVPAHYGYLKGTCGRDKDHIDVYIGPKPNGLLVFVVNQHHEDGGFDEHKCMLGFESKEEAIRCYDAAFSDGLGPKLRDSVVSTTMKKFKEWLQSGKCQKPFASLEESVQLIVNRLLESHEDELKDMALSMPYQRYQIYRQSRWDTFWLRKIDQTVSWERDRKLAAFFQKEEAEELVQLFHRYENGLEAPEGAIVNQPAYPYRIGLQVFDFYPAEVVPIRIHKSKSQA